MYTEAAHSVCVVLRNGDAVGTGWVASASGTICTAAHVLREGTTFRLDGYAVRFHDGLEHSVQVKSLWYDQSTAVDLAAFEVSDGQKLERPPFALADESKLKSRTDCVCLGFSPAHKAIIPTRGTIDGYILNSPAKRLLKVTNRQENQNGHSGAPLFIPDTRMLVGMHVSGVDGVPLEEIVHAVPSWRIAALLDAGAVSNRPGSSSGAFDTALTDLQLGFNTGECLEWCTRDDLKDRGDTDTRYVLRVAKQKIVHAAGRIHPSAISANLWTVSKLRTKNRHPLVVQSDEREGFFLFSQLVVITTRGARSRGDGTSISLRAARSSSSVQSTSLVAVRCIEGREVMVVQVPPHANQEVLRSMEEREAGATHIIGVPIITNDSACKVGSFASLTIDLACPAGLKQPEESHIREQAVRLAGFCRALNNKWGLVLQAAGSAEDNAAPTST